MMYELLKNLSVFCVSLALFSACEPVPEKKEDPCSTCLEESRVLVPLSCSEVNEPGWSLSDPFGVPAAELPPVLQKWCLLTGPIPAPALSLAPSRVSVDRPNVFPQSSGFAPTIWPALHARFLNQSAAVQGLPPAVEGLAPVDVAIIDDAWDLAPGEPGDGYRRHGRTLGLIIRELACPYGQHDSCPIYLSNHRALRCDEGRSGTRVQLAREIYEAVVAWQQRDSSRATSAKLIINLSVGFEDDGSVGTQLVRNAIEVATCHGALVIAAAGNVRPDGSGMGPLLPGGFESEAVPSSCVDHAIPNHPYGFDTPPARPLVQAASGVEDRGVWLPLLTTRPQGRASIAAPAFHAVAADPLTGAPFGPSDVLTGSSVSAAVTSAVAALLWTHVPALQTIELMSTIKETSTPLGGHADFGPDPMNLEPIGLIGACPALASACATSGSPACMAAGVTAMSCTSSVAAIEPWDTETIDALFLSGAFKTGQGAKPSSCPANLSAVGPQPGDLGCGACVFKASNRTLYIAVDTTYEGAFTPQQLIIRDLSNVDHAIEIPGDPVLQAGEELQVVLDNMAMIPDAGQAKIVDGSNAFAPIDWF